MKNKPAPAKSPPAAMQSKIHQLSAVQDPKAAMRDLCGSQVEQFNTRLLNDVVATGYLFGIESKDEKNNRWIAMAVALNAFHATDEIEGMIAAQAVAMHHGVMECARRAMIRDQPHEIAQGYRKAAANMSRAFTELLSALDRKRGKSGQQKVTVEHVHVHAGGKAIVGAVAPPIAGGGGGGERRTRDEPHAPSAALEHNAAVGAVLTPLRRGDAEQEPVPVARYGKRQVPDARGR